MHFAIDGGTWFTGGGLVLILIVGVLALSMLRYNAVERPEEEQEIADQAEAERREERAIHENDVET